MPPDCESRTALTLLRIWTGIGLQSFGGGASTLLLIRRAFVEQRSWVSDEEMSRMWNLCLLTPGINLIALTVLIGRKIGGVYGIVASLAGLLVPSATLTCLLAAGYAAVQHSPLVHAIMRGVVPATAGVMAVVALNFARPLMRQGQAEGARRLGLSILFIVAAAVTLIVLKLSIIIVLVAAAVCGALALSDRRSETAPVRAPQPLAEEGRAR